MKRLILTIFSFIVISAGAQDLEEKTSSDIWLEQIYSIRQISPSGNLAYIEQTGDANVLITEQVQSGGIINPNIIEARQTGNGNFSSSYQEGYGLVSSNSQNGNGNIAITNLKGGFIESQVAQIGQNQLVEQYIEGNASSYRIIQEGYDNVLIHRENEPNPKQMIIRQNGNGMRLMIENFMVQ